MGTKMKRGAVRPPLCAVVVLTRAPRPGFTKTRMMPPFGPEECAAFHRALLADVAAACRSASAFADVFVALSCAEAKEDVAAAFDVPSVYFEQSGDGLGKRLCNAARTVFSRGYDRCVLLGSDAPETTCGDVRRALDALDGADAAIGPAFDGGYYLIALSRPIDELFGLSSYGHERVLEETLDAARAAGCSVALLRPIADIDCWPDAEALLERALRDERVAGLSSVRYLRRFCAERSLREGLR